MTVITYIGYIVLALICFFGYCSIRYRNDYKLVMIFGPKGCGKTTYLTKLAFKYISLGRPVYSTESIPGTYKISPKDVGYVQFPAESVLLIDEVGMIYDNRKFKSFSDEVRDYYKLQRHYKNTVYLFSQCFDIDVKLRDLTDQMYMLKSYFNCISIGQAIRKQQDIVEATGMSESRIVYNLKIMPFFLPGARVYTWLPRWHKYFDSFTAPALKPKDYFLTPFPKGVSLPRKYRRRSDRRLCRQRRRRAAALRRQRFLLRLAPLLDGVRRLAASLLFRLRHVYAVTAAKVRNWRRRGGG